MWTCKQCQKENEDGAAFCPQCGAKQAAGRFDTGAKKREKVFRKSVSYRVPDTGVNERKARRVLLPFLARLAGSCLMALLPLCTLALSILQRDTLKAALLPLFLEGGPEWLGTAIYVLLCAAAVLVSLLPGLWTYMLGRENR